MKTNDELLKYLAGILQGQEKENFEHKLMQSESLQKELQEHQQLFAGLKNLNDVTAENSYFDNLLPKVRQKLERKRKSGFYPKLAYALPVAAVIAYFIVNPFSRKGNDLENEIGITIADIEEDSKTDILNDIMDNESSSMLLQVVNDSSNTEILERNIVSQLFSDDYEKSRYLDTDDLVGSLSGEEEQEVYNSLLNKKIL